MWWSESYTLTYKTQLNSHDAANCDDFTSNIKSKLESPGSILVSIDKTDGAAKSADEVSFTQKKKLEQDPRKIKSDHHQESRFKKILCSARGLLPERKK